MDGIGSNTYKRAPNPEDLPDYMQQELIGGIMTPEIKAQYAANPFGGTARSTRPNSLAHGLDIDSLGQGKFVRSKGGDELWIDYEDPGNGVVGPVIGPGGRVFGSVAEAEKAAYALGREKASDQAWFDRLSPEEQASLEEEQAPNRKPLDFAYGGAMQLRRPASVVDRSSGQVIANAAMNGPEQVSFGGEQPWAGTRGVTSRFGDPMAWDYSANIPQGGGERPDYSGMIGTENPRLVDENPGMYHLLQPPQRRDPFANHQSGVQRRPLNFMTQPPLVPTLPVQGRNGGRRPLYNPQKMLDAMRT
jgi:hypothetical protein